jgi:DNA-binding NtrC family response regulator
VLVVDDEPGVLAMLQKLLSLHNLEVSGVLTGQEALALLARERFGCLLVDKNLPDVSGLEVLRAARQRQPFCACLLMTGYPNTESVIEAMRLGAVDYLAKPFTELGLVAQRVLTTMAFARISFEREELAQALQQMRRELKWLEEKGQEQQTALQVFRNVLARKVEEATLGGAIKRLRMESSVREARERVVALSSQLSGPLREQALELIELLSPPVKPPL